MAFIPNPNGTFQVTDADGNEIANDVPPEWVPSDVISQLASAGRTVAQAAPEPPPEPAPSLYNPVSPPVIPEPESPELASNPPQAASPFKLDVRPLPPRNASDLPQITSVEGGDQPLFSGAPSSAGSQKMPKWAEQRFNNPNPYGVEVTQPSAPAAPPTVSGKMGAQVGAGGPDLASEMHRDVVNEALTGRNVYSPGRKEGDVLQSFSVERQRPLPEDVKLGQAMAYQNAIDTARTNAAALSDAQTQLALGYEKQRDAAKKQLDDIKLLDDRRDAALKPKIDAIDKQSEAIRTFKIDPDAYWRKKGAFGTMLTRIGLALGAFGSALTGTPDTVAQMIRGEMDDEMTAQKSELDAMKSSTEAATNTLAQMRQMYLSPEASEHATRALLMESMAAETRRLAAEMGSADALAKGEEIAAKFSLDAADWRSKAAQLEGGALRELFKHQTALAGGMVHIGPRNKAEQLMVFKKVGDVWGISTAQAVNLWADPNASMPATKEEAAMRQQAQKLQFQVNQTSLRDPETGLRLYAPNKERADKWAIGFPALVEMKRNLIEIKEIYKKDPTGISAGYNTKLRGQISAKVSNALSNAKNAIVGDAIQKEEAERLSSMTGKSATDFINFVNEEAQWNEGINLIDQRIRDIRAQLRTEDDAYAVPVGPPPGEKQFKIPAGAVPVKPAPKPE